MQWEIRLQFILVWKIARLDTSTVLVLGGDDMVDNGDFVKRLENRIRVRKVLPGVSLVDVRNYSPILELPLRPAWEAMPIFCIRIEILLLQLELPLHTRGCVA